MEGQQPKNKIFVGGLPRGITSLEFETYFRQFGTIIDSVILHNKETKMCRGFGFVTFDDRSPVTVVLQKPFHKLKGKLVEVKEAKPKPISPPMANPNCHPLNLPFNHYNTLNRLYVGLSPVFKHGYNPSDNVWLGPASHYGNYVSTIGPNGEASVNGSINPPGNNLRPLQITRPVGKPVRITTPDGVVISNLADLTGDNSKSAKKKNNLETN